METLQKEIYTPREESHQISTFDSHGVPINLKIVLTMDQTGTFTLKGDMSEGKPVRFVNYWGDNYEKFTVLEIKNSTNNGSQALFGKKGYIQFKSEASSDTFDGPQISYSFLEK